MKKYISVADKNPSIAKSWDHNRNGAHTPQTCSFGSHLKVFWLCQECGASFERVIKDQSKRTVCLCPHCARQQAAKKKQAAGVMKRAANTRTKNKIAQGKSVQDLYPEIAKRWDYEQNAPKTPADYTCGSHAVVNWICDKGHKYKRMIKTELRGNACPVCTNNELAKGINDLKTVRPDIAAEWNYERNNGLLPEDVVAGSAKVVWWKCKNGHEWKAKVYERTAKGHGCAECKGLKLITGVNDFATLYPEIAAQWDYSKNEKRPEEYGAYSTYRAHWKCSKGHEWSVSIRNRVAEKTGCPICKKELKTSFPEQAVFFYIEKYFPDADNRTACGGVEADICIESLKTVVEYDGVYWHKRKASRDDVKTNAFISAGYRVIRLREKGLGKVDNALCISVGDPQKNASLTKAITLLLKELGVADPVVDLKNDNEAIYNRFVSVRKANSISNVRPELLLYWDYDKNKLDPNNVAMYSRARVHWKCPVCNYEWIATAHNKAHSQALCPQCSKAEYKKRAGKKVVNLDTGVVFSSLGDAAKSCNGLRANISSCCTGKRQSAYGYHWAYYKK